MKRKMILTLLMLILTSSIFSQTTQENLLENVEIKFTLQGEPNPQDVGFDNPKSFWKVKYELYLADFSELEKLSLSKTDKGIKFIPPIIQNKNRNKQIKKKSSKILKGGFTKRSLSNEANREVIIPVKLSPQVVEVFNQASTAPDKNPTFILFVAEKVSVTNSANVKLRDKYRIVGFSSVKHDLSDQTVDDYNVKNISLTIKIIKQENGQLKLTGFLVY